MKVKRLSLLVGTLIVAVGLTGCMGGPKLPEGDVKVVTQPAQGVVNLLLESSNYGKENTVLASLVLPKDSKYELNLTMEKYVDGKLEDTIELQNYTTAVMGKNTPVNLVANTSKVNDKNKFKSIFSFAEIDEKKTTDDKNPEYKVTKVFEEPMNYDVKVESESIGTDLGKVIPVSAYVKFKDDDKEKNKIELNNYKEQVKNYKEVNVLNLKVTKK